MSLRDSLDLIKAVNPEGGQAVLEHEIMAERASSLNAAEAKVAKTMSALHAEKTPETLANARDAVWAYFVQRELVGFKRHQDVIAAFGITREVLNGLGVVRRQPPSTLPQSSPIYRETPIDMSPRTRKV